jgi:iron complex transport system ATP-binding protein
MIHTNLLIKNLEVSIGNKIICHKLNLLLSKGTILAIIGSNGVGKSTLLNHIAGLHKIALDTIFINQKDLGLMSRLETAQNISSIAQFDHTPKDILAKERILHGLAPYLGFNHIPAMNDNFYQLAKQLQIEHLLSKSLKHLSGGELKKVHIARCFIAKQASVFIIDEPFASLDNKQKQIVKSCMISYAKLGKIVIFSAHEINEINGMECRIIKLN